MESLLTNIALIMAKELINDAKKTETAFTSLGNYDSENDDEAEFFFLQQHQPLKVREKKSEVPKKAFAEVDFLNQFNDSQFKNYLHMNKTTFLQLFHALRHLFTNRNFPLSLTSQTVFSLAIWKLTTDEHFEQIGKRFDIPVSDCQNSIRSFWELIADNSTEFIKCPSKKECMEKHKKYAKTIPEVNKLRNLYGIVAVKSLHIFFEDNEEEAEVIWQIVCDLDKNIIDCYVERLSDYTFDTTPIGQMLTNFIPEQFYLIGDESFPIKQNLRRPFVAPNSKDESKFNMTLRPILQLPQQVFEISAKRFNALYDSESKNLKELRKIISAICCLYNLCLRFESEQMPT